MSRPPKFALPQDRGLPASPAPKHAKRGTRRRRPPQLHQGSSGASHRLEGLWAELSRRTRPPWPRIQEDTGPNLESLGESSCSTLYRSRQRISITDASVMICQGDDSVLLPCLWETLRGKVNSHSPCLHHRRVQEACLRACS